MSFKGTNFSEGNALSNAEIKSILLNIYDRLTKPSTKEVGYELFLKLILKNLFSPSSMSFILSQLSEFIPPLPPKEKEPCLKLLSLIFFDPISASQNSPNKKKTIYFQYISSVLSIIQSLTKDSNNSIFPSIANTYAEIVQNTMPTDIIYASEDLDMEERRGYEMLQGFCIYNMKQEEKANRIIGSLCLTKLVENCPIVLQEQYMKFIWDNIITFIDTKNYTAKYELLNCLISLILGAEGLFAPFANSTLYKVLDFLTEDDWNKRKLALNVIYTLIFYCKDEIMPLKDHIINFLRVLKTDKVKEVREVCLLILQIFNENEPVKKRNEKEKSIGSIVNKNKISKNTFNIDKKENNDNIQKPKNKSKPKTTLRQKKNNKFFENNKKFSTNPFKDNSFEEHNNRRNNNTNNINNIASINDEENNSKPPISIQSKTSKETNTNTIGTNIGTGTSNIHAHNHNRSKGKKSNNFVNEKMVIKPDPNKSIFKAIPNPAFFGQGNKKNNDIVIMVKEKPKNIAQNNIINKNKNKINNNENENIKNIKNNISQNENNNKFVNKDENSINKNRINESDNNIRYSNKNEKPEEDLRYKNMFNNNNDNDNDNDNNNDKENVKLEEENENINLNKEKEEYNNYNENNNNENENDNENDIENDNENYYEDKKINKYEKEKEKGNEIEDSANLKIIQKLLAQMDFLTKGHNSLMNMFDNIQLDTQEQIENLNQNIGNLESKTNNLNRNLNDYCTNSY